MDTTSTQPPVQDEAQQDIATPQPQVAADTTVANALEDRPIPAEVRVYLEAILEEADLLIISDEEQERIIQNMYKQLDMFLFHKMVENVPEDKLDALSNLEDGETNTEKIKEFISANIPNIQDVLAKSFEEFRELYLNNVVAEEARMQSILEDKNDDPTTILEKLKYDDTAQTTS